MINTLKFLLLSIGLLRAQLLITFDETSYSFGEVVVGESVTIEATLENTFGLDLDVSISGVNAPFLVSSESLTIVGSGTETLDITFSPTSIATFNDTLYYQYTGDSNLHPIYLSGTGIQVEAT